MNVMTTTVDAMTLKSRSTLATINAGGNMSLNADNITNQYSLISAGGNIHLAAKVADNLPVNILSVTTVSTVMSRNQRYCKGVDLFGICVGGHGNRMIYSGTKVSTSKQVSNTVAATIQAGGSITGNVANLTNGNIRSNQTIAAPIAQTASTATAANSHTTKTVAVNGGNIPAVTAASLALLEQPVISLPKGQLGLFIVSPDPTSQYLIETNPAFTVYNNFISSNYMLQHINFSPEQTIKRVGDDFYENKLIRDSIFAQTGRRFLRPGIASDYAQYKYLMDNALKAQADLQLVPGVALTSMQVAALNNDIVWLVEQQIAGQKVLVPVVYIVNAHDYKIEGGKIIASDNIDLAVAKLKNSGFLEAGNNLTITADAGIINKNGSIRAGSDLSLQAKHDIENISADMRATNITLATLNGDIINTRYTEAQSFAGGHDQKTVTGKAGSIAATGNLALDAGKTIAITGSKLKGDNINLNAKQVAIGTTVKTSNFAAAADGISLQQEAVTHLGSIVEGSTIAINTRGVTRVSGSRVTAKDNLAIHASKMDVLAVNDSHYEEDRTTSSGFLSHQSTTTKQATATNIGSQLSAGNVLLGTTGGDIAVTGSHISAQNKLALSSAGTIDVRTGFDGSLDETHTRKSGFFTGGALYSKSNDLEGKLSKTAVLATLKGNTISLTAENDLVLNGVDVTAPESLAGAAQNISVENVNNEVKTYSKHERMTVGLGDIGKTLTRPDKLIKHKDGKFSVILARAGISTADKTTTTNTVIATRLEAGNINLVADSKDRDQGNVFIKGSHLTANNGVSLTASNNVTIKEAKNTEKTASKTMNGTAVLSLTARNEYIQIGYAVKAAKKAKANLQKARRSYARYRDERGKQRAKLVKLKAGLADGTIGIEQADVDEMQGLIDDLNGDEAYYRANIVLATANLASKTTAVASQMATAAQSSGAYGFSAALELDIEAREKKFNTYKEQSVASKLNAQDITLAAGNTATVQGSDLNAASQIDIAAKDTHILASQDVSTRSHRSEHKSLTISIGMYGGAGDSASLSADSSKDDSRGLTQHNSQLNANTINIGTRDTTTITGANIAASDSLTIHTKHLDVASVQDSQNSRASSQGFSMSGSLSGGVSGVGANRGRRHSSARRTVLTTLMGSNVNINVAKNTILKGATIAAVDKKGNDSGNLTLKTGTLDVSSLNNTRNSKSLSVGLNVGIANQKQRDHSNNKSTASSLGIDFANDRASSKTKTLGTIGSGTIHVANVDKSSTRMLNRDVKNNEINIYDIKSHRGLKGTVDMRMFTKEGRKRIREDIERSKRLGQAIGDVVNNDAFKLKDTFAHISETQKDLDVQKAFALANGGKGIETPQGKKVTLEQKQTAVKKYAEIYAKAYDITIEQANIIATSKVIGGTHYGNHGKSYIDVNDNAGRNATDYANTLGHEVAHARISQHKARNRGNRKLNEQYADTMGGYSSEGMQFSSMTYNSVNLNLAANANTHSQTARDTKLLARNDASWRAKLTAARHGDGKVDYLLPAVVKEWRDKLNQYMVENRKISASLKGDAAGTALSITAAPADIVVDLANMLITTVDVTTDGLGSTGALGKDLQAKALQNLSDMGVKIDDLVRNRKVIAASVVKSLKAYPDRIAELDPSALRSLTAIIGEIAMPVAAITRLKEAEDVAKAAAELPYLPSVKGEARDLIAENKRERKAVWNMVEADAEKGNVFTPRMYGGSVVTKSAGKEIGILRDAAKGKGNFGLGSGSRAEADKLGKAWVGDGYKVASDGKTLVGKDGLRQYRPPSYKGRLGKTQANFEQKFPGQKTKGWQSNGHLDITD